MSNQLQPTKASNVASIYADGTAQGNPGKGGYGVVVVEGDHRRELSGGFRKTMNSRMELLAVIQGLQALTEPNTKVTVYSDSEQVVKMFTDGKAENWRQSGWVKRNGSPATVNPDLWDMLLTLVAKHEVKMVWVHDNGKNQGSPRSEMLAVAARQKEDLPPDEGYESPKAPDVPEQLAWMQ